MGCVWQLYKAISVLFFTLFLALVLIGLVLVAGLGWVDVPILSDIMGQSPAPTPTPAATAVPEAKDSGTPAADSSATATPLASTPPPPALSAEALAIQRAEDALKQADEPGEFTIEVADTDLTALLGEVINALDNPPVSNLVITFEEDEFVVSGTVTTPFRADVSGRGHFVVGEESVQVAFSEARLGALVMPEALRDQFALQANQYLAENIGVGEGLRIDSVEIDPGTITVTGERLQ